MKKTWFAIVGIYISVVLIFIVFLYYRINEKLSLIQKEDVVYQLRTDTNTLAMMIMANKVEEICKECSSKEEQAIAITKWVAENISNREYDLEFEKKPDKYSWFATRNGKCGVRSVICVEMLKYVNIDANVLNMYDFPHNQTGGHSCVEVYYDDKPHFFDCSYGGYFADDRGVLSIDEIVEDPETAIKGMVIYGKTYDKESNGAPVINDERMRMQYTVDNLRRLKSYGVVSKSNPIVIYPQIDMDIINGTSNCISIGSVDNDNQDVIDDGAEMDFSSNLHLILSDPRYDQCVEGEWIFNNCTIGDRYYLEFNTYATYGNEDYLVEGENLAVVNGGSFSISESTDSNSVWRIEFEPKDENCRLKVVFDADDSNGCAIDMINIGKII